MTTSPHLGIPLIDSQQAQPEVTHNEAVLLLQALSAGALGLQNAPPVSPADGDVWIVGSAGSGAWNGRSNRVAIYFGGTWLFVPGFDSDGVIIAMGAAQEGLMVYRQDLNALWIWTGAAWADFATVVAGSFVAKSGDTMTGPLIINSATTPLLTMEADNNAVAAGSFLGISYAASANGGFLVQVRGSRGSKAVPADNISGDRLGEFIFGGYCGGGFRTTASLLVRTGTGTFSATSFPTFLAINTTPDGSVSRSERLRIDQDGNLGVGADIWLDANRIFRLRSYTVATLPASPVAGSQAYCSNESGGAVPVFGDGTNWRRVTDRAIAS